MSKPVVLSLFDYTGNWSRPWTENGYDVRLVDLKHGQDILAWQPPDCPVYCVLAAPPCTDFSVSGAQFWAEKDNDGRTIQSLRLIGATFRIVNEVNPTVFALENPVGRLGSIIGLKPKMYFHPYEFAQYAPDPEKDRYTKKTCLWGTFNIPEKRPLEPIFYTTKDGKRGSWQWAKLGGKSERTKELRSATPLGFAYAFYEANKLRTNSI